MQTVRVLEAIRSSQFGDESLVCFEFPSGDRFRHEEDVVGRETALLDHGHDFSEVRFISDHKFEIRFTGIG